MIDLLDESNRLGRDPGRKPGVRYLRLVRPIYARLEAVHESYMVHFRKYREMIAGWGGAFGPDHPIFDSLEHDHLFTQTERLKLVAMTGTIPLLGEPERTKLTNPASAPPGERPYYCLMSLLAAISGYFEAADEAGDPDFVSNLPRGNLLYSLRALFRSSPEDECEWADGSDPLGGEWVRRGRFAVSGSRSRMQQLRVELAGADADEVRRALALAKIDEIVTNLLRRFERVACSVERINALQLYVAGTDRVLGE
jgi:hypothetical protein